MSILKKMPLVFILMLGLCLVLAAPALAQTAGITGMVFVDADGNGLHDPGEIAITGAEITLVSQAEGREKMIGSVLSDKEGQYSFGALAAGSYYMQISLPGDLQLTTPQEAGSFAFLGQGGKSRSPLFTLTQGEQSIKLFGGVKRSASINFISFVDKDENGGRRVNDAAIRGVDIALINEFMGQSQVVASGRTDRDGELRLRDLSQGEYRVAVVMPEPFIVGPIGQKINNFYNTVLPTQGREGLSETILAGRSLGLGIGGVKAGTLSGQIWLDSNMNGIRDAGEDGHEGILITLTHLGMGIERSLSTGTGGSYQFDYLQGGEYSLKVSLPQGLMFALPGSPSIFSDGYQESQQKNIHISTEGISQVDAIGVMPASGIQLAAFLDSNANGLLDDSEHAFAGAQLDVVDGETILASVLTDSNGQAMLPRVRGGQVHLRLTLPDGQVFSIDGGEDGNAFFSTTATSLLDKTIDLAHGQVQSLKLGVTLPAQISGTLFEDSNLSGTWDEQEQPIAGFLVQAMDRLGNIAAEAYTDASGQYTLQSLVPSSYVVRFSLESPYVFSDSSAASAETKSHVIEQTAEHGQTDLVHLLPGQLQEGINAGAFRSAVLNGKILLGDEHLGFEGLSGGLEGVFISLLNEAGEEVSRHTVATSDQDGAFSLKGALPGFYYISYHLPKGSKFSQPHTDETTFKSELMEVKAADQLVLTPLYAVKTASISGTAFVDSNLNGSRDQEDPGLEGVVLELREQTTGEVYRSQSSPEGSYLLEGIRPGNYEAQVWLPSGYSLDQHEHSLMPAALDGASLSDIQLGMGQTMADTVLSAVPSIRITGHTFLDHDMNLGFDQQLDSPYQVVFTLSHLRTGQEFKLTSQADGSYALDLAYPGEYRLSLNLPSGEMLTMDREVKNEQGLWTATLMLQEQTSRLDLPMLRLGSIQGRVWNMDGSAKNLEGIHISLLDEQGEVQAATSTDAQGAYSFVSLLPVSYRLSVTLPENYRFARLVDTAEHASIITSDLTGLDTHVGSSESFALGMGEHRTEQDVGMGSMGRLGDYAWLDLDKDGMQDGDEPGIPGLLIKVYQHGQLAAQAVTDDYGFYMIDTLFPGRYTLEVQMPEELLMTKHQNEFPLVASILTEQDGQMARALDVIVPSGGRNLNADLGFVLKREGVLPDNMKNLAQKDWTEVNDQKPSR